jgi:hypothetical protein
VSGRSFWLPEITPEGSWMADLAFVVGSGGGRHRGILAGIAGDVRKSAFFNTEEE